MNKTATDDVTSARWKAKLSKERKARAIAGQKLEDLGDDIMIMSDGEVRHVDGGSCWVTVEVWVPAADLE